MASKTTDVTSKVYGDLKNLKVCLPDTSSDINLGSEANISSNSPLTAG